MTLEQINKLILDLVNQISCLAEAQDVEFLKLTEKLNSHPVWGTTRKSIKNGDCCVVFHLAKLKELLEEQQKILLERDKHLKDVV